jgi:rare lipoprotein A
MSHPLWASISEQKYLHHVWPALNADHWCLDVATGGGCRRTTIGCYVCPSAYREAQLSGMCAFYPGRGGGLTAAHKTLPFGTRVRVTDSKTGRSVIVVINDRGPFNKGRVLDLSTSAAKALGMMERGVVLVRADVL